MWQILLAKLTDLFESRRFWAAVTAVIVIVLQELLNIPEDKAQWIVSTLLAWILGDSISKTEGTRMRRLNK